MRLYLAAKLHTGDEVRHKRTRAVCKVVAVVPIRQVDPRPPHSEKVVRVCLSIVDPQEGYLEVLHTDVM